jgi:hypothetical protein
MTRSVIEGVSFGLRDSMELIKSAGLGKIEQVLFPAAARAALSGGRCFRCDEQ